MAITSKNPFKESKRNVTIDQEQLWDVKDVAKYMKVTESTIYGHTRQTGPHSIPRLKVGRHLRFVKNEIDIWLDSNRGGFRP